MNSESKNEKTENQGELNLKEVKSNQHQPHPEKFTYAVLQETNGEEYESWLYFIRYQGNESELAHIKRQLETVDWTMDDDLSCFDLETDYLVSEQTAKEMTKVDLNHCSFHRKFDGKLKRVDLGFKSGQSDSKKIRKAFKVLGYGKIENFIDREDIDPEDLNNESESGSETSSSEDNSLCESNDDSDSSVSSSEHETEEVETKKGKQNITLPKSSKIEIPRIAKAKQTNAKKQDKKKAK